MAIQQLALFARVTLQRDTLAVGTSVYLRARDVRGLGIDWRLRGGAGVVTAVREDACGTYYVVRLERSGRVRFARRDELRVRRERMRDRHTPSNHHGVTRRHAGKPR